MTIKDIAKLAGCSVSTVSRALNGHHDINAATKAKIQAIIDEYNYTPNQNAKQLKQLAGNSILMLVNGGENPFFSPLIREIEAYAGRAGVSISLHYLDEREDEVLAAIQLCTEQKPIGIIFLGGDLNNFRENFKKISLPCVLSTANAEGLEFTNLSSVSVDDFAGGAEAVNRLIELGHEKIGIICGDSMSEGPSGVRFRGAASALNRGEYDTSICESSEYTLSSAYNAAIALRRKYRDMTAIFAMSDILAIGAVRAFSDMKIRVPEDISVIGFDGIEMADFYNPRIATLKQPMSRIAEQTVTLLMDMIDNGAAGRHILLKAEYRDGGSVCRKYKEENK